MRYVTLSRLLAAFIMVVLCSLMACGSNGKNPLSGTPTTTSTPQPNIGASATPGQVKLVLDKSHYALNDAITVTIANGLSSTIFASAYYTNCTLVMLELKMGTTWVPQGICRHGMIPSLIPLKPGSVTPQQLTSETGTFRPATSATWQAGIYRVVFAYGLTPDPGSTHSVLVQSEEFTIG